MPDPDPDEDSGPIVGSGSFLADMGEDFPDELRLKYLMANEIAAMVGDRALTQAEVARVIGLARPDVSRIVNGRVKEYSVERLLRVMTALGKNVHVVRDDAPGPRGFVGVGIPDPLLDSLRDASLADDAEYDQDARPALAMGGP